MERRSPTRESYRISRPLECVECGVIGERDAPGWRGYRTDDPETNEEPKVSFYCAYCAIREFG